MSTWYIGYNTRPHLAYKSWGRFVDLALRGGAGLAHRVTQLLDRQELEITTDAVGQTTSCIAAIAASHGAKWRDHWTDDGAAPLDTIEWG